MITMNNKIMPVSKREIVMADAVFADTDPCGRTIFQGIIMEETNKQRYRETGRKRLFTGHIADLEPGAIHSIESRLIPDTAYDCLYQVIHADLLAGAPYAAMWSFLLRSEHMTPKRARLLLTEYGMNVLDEIANDYHALDFLMLSPDVQSGIHIFARKRLLFGEALRLLMKYRMDCRLAAGIYDAYKSDPIEKTLSAILDQPYQLFADDVCTFHQSDALYLRMGNPPDGEMRCRYAILAALRAAEKNGGICIPRQDIHGAMWAMLQTLWMTEYVLSPAQMSPKPLTG